MNNFTGKLVATLLALFLVAYVGYQGYRYLYSPLKTEVAQKYVIEDTLYAQGVVIRDEVPVSGDTAGVVRYFYDDGVRVITGTPVAEVHSSLSNVKDKQRLEEIDKQLAKLNEIQSGTKEIYNISTISAKIEEQLANLVVLGQSGKLDTAGTVEDDLQNALNQKAVVIGQNNDFTEKISRLTSEKSELERRLISEKSQILSPAYGYFSSYYDMASEISTELLNTATVEKIEALASARYEQNSGYAGKVILGYTWYYAAVLEKKDVQKLTAGKEVKLFFPLVTAAEIPAKVDRIIEDASGQKAVAIFACDYMSDELSRMRNPSVQIELGGYSGLKIPYKALRFENNQQGVYVIKNQTVTFKKVYISYEEIGFFISGIDANDKDRVQLYDDIVVEGMDLYDGKPIG